MGLVAPEMVAGSTPAGLNLVGDEQYPPVVQFFLNGPEEAVGWGGEASDPLNGFGNHGGHLAGGHHVEHLGEVVNARRGVSLVVKLAERTT